MTFPALRAPVVRRPFWLRTSLASLLTGSDVDHKAANGSAAAEFFEAAFGSAYTTEADCASVISAAPPSGFAGRTAEELSDSLAFFAVSLFAIRAATAIESGSRRISAGSMVSSSDERREWTAEEIIMREG